MKNLKIWGMLVLLIAALSCHKSADLIDGRTPDQRLAAALKKYKSVLTSAPYGWILVETTTGKAINQGVTKEGPKASFAYFMEFSDSDRVSMYSDFDIAFSGTPNVSSFHISGLQRPTLVFDTYSYIHVPCDPNPAVSKSPFGAGMGWGSDFEYSFADNVSPDALKDTIRLIGNLNSAGGVMVKATQAQRDAYRSGQLQRTMAAFSTGIKEYFRLGFMNGNLAFEMTPGVSGSNSAQISFCDPDGYIRGNEIYTVGYYFTPGSLHFTEPAGRLSSIDNINPDAANDRLTCNFNGSLSSSGGIRGNTFPLQINVNAPKVWWQSAANVHSYYRSTYGFHKNGVDDYYQFTKLASWQCFAYFPYYGNNGAFNYDIFGAMFSNDGTGGLIIPSFPDVTMIDTATSAIRFTDDGRIRFLGGFPAGNYNYPAFWNTMDDLTEPNGYYMILKPDGKTWDMVGALDARTWMRWVR